MPIEKWSEKILLVHLSDDPQFTEELHALEETIGSVQYSAVLDFASVHIINSSNISRLLRVRRQAITNDGRVILCNISTQVWGSFLVTGLDKVFEFSDDVTTALATAQMDRQA